MSEIKRPEWVPENAGKEFTTNVMEAAVKPDKKTTNIIKRKKITTEEYAEGILNGDMMILSQAITLIESNSPKHNAQAQELIKILLPHTGKSIRIGITGSPGAGKSTLIENLGVQLCDKKLKTAVLAIDPSSSITKGSILGDKTRMEQLSSHPYAFIRPSPSSGTLGGVATKTRETMLLCEAAGYEVILIETVGVGQSEITVRSMVDFFMLLLLPGAGDELQGIKKGVVELADMLVVNKRISDNSSAGALTRAQYQNALHLLSPATEGWKTPAMICQALDGVGVWDLWETINDFRENTKNSGMYKRRRERQILEWIYNMVDDGINRMFYGNPVVKSNLAIYEQSVTNGEKTPTQAAQELLNIFKEQIKSK